MLLTHAAVCGPLCQHPSCWENQRKLARGSSRKKSKTVHKSVPLATKRQEKREESDVGYNDDFNLPAQSVVNLLDDYGFDPADRFPSKFKGRPLHERTKSIMSALELQSHASANLQLPRTGTRESTRKGRAPQATPASTTTPKYPINDIKQPFPVATMHVQEVFEFEELNRNWNETFEKKQYYVWVPNPNKKKKRRKSTGDAINKITELNMGPKDITEELVPQHVQDQRESTVMFDDVWPMYKRPPAGPSRGSARMPPAPPSESPSPRRSTRKHQYYGIYEMLDLPREVLTEILDHVPERDMMNRERFAQALASTLPILQKETKSVGLASSNILQQKPMQILDGRLKPTRNTPMDFSSSRQVFVLDDEVLEKISNANTPQPLSLEGATGNITTPRSLPSKPPVPPIPIETDKPPKVRTIALGLPEIPSGVKATRPFAYKGVTHDFTLGPIPTPERRPSFRDSPRTSDACSTLHVTVPSATTEDQTRLTYYCYYDRSSWATEEESNAFNTSLGTAAPGVPMNTPLNTPYAQSPSPVKGMRSFHSPTGAAPLPPVNTPMGPAVTELTSMSAADLQAGALGTIAESESGDVPERVRQGPPPRSSKSVRFAPEVEEDEEGDDAEGGAADGRRSLTTAGTVESGAAGGGAEVGGATRSVSGKTDRSLSVNMHTTVYADRGMSRRSMNESAPPSRGHTKASSINSLSPEPWPEVNEAELARSPSPPAGRGLTTTSTSASSVCGDSGSMAVNVDARSDKTALSSHGVSGAMDVNVDARSGKTALSSVAPPASRHGLSSRERMRESAAASRAGLHSRDSLTGRPTLSRESTISSDKLSRMMQEHMVDSPGPPPPSPEPKNQNQPEPLSKENTGLSQLDDILETDSEFTISARPPSNLEDSTFNTPTLSAAPHHRQNKPSQLAQYLGTRSRERSELDEQPAEAQVAREATDTTIPSDSITLPGAESIPPRTGNSTKSKQSIVDAHTLAQQQASQKNSTFKSNSVARTQPALSRGQLALDLDIGARGRKSDKTVSERGQQLDTFGASEDTFRAQLRGEMEKLSSVDGKNSSTKQKDAGKGRQRHDSL